MKTIGERLEESWEGTERPEEIHGIKYLSPKQRRIWFIEELLDVRFSIWEKNENSLKVKDLSELLDSLENRLGVDAGLVEISDGCLTDERIDDAEVQL